MNFGGIFGVVTIVASIAFFIINLVTSYRTQGGAIGQVPVMAMPVVLPVMAMMGLGLIDQASGWPDWPKWAYVLGWVLLTPIAWWLTDNAGHRGEARAKNLTNGGTSDQG